MATPSLQPCPGSCFVSINRLMNQPSGRTDRREQAILTVTKRYCACQRQLQFCKKGA
jgi:hypothetical protein